MERPRRLGTIMFKNAEGCLHGRDKARAFAKDVC